MQENCVLCLVILFKKKHFSNLKKSPPEVYGGDSLRPYFPFSKWFLKNK